MLNLLEQVSPWVCVCWWGWRGGGDNRSKYGRGDVSEGDSVKDKNET